MDAADRADERIQQTVSDGIQEASRAQGLRPTGFCYNCNEAVQPGRLFCDQECRDDYDWLQSRKKANG